MNPAAADPSPALTVAVCLSGGVAEGQLFYESALRSVDGLPRDDLELIYIFDGPVWRAAPFTQMVAIQEGRRAAFLKARTDLPSALFTEALGRAKGRRILFLHPSLPVSSRAISDLAMECGRDFSDAILAVKNIDSLHSNGLPVEAPAEMLHGWLRVCECLQLSVCAVPRDALRQAGGFDPSPILQRGAGWDMLIRMTARSSIRYVGCGVEGAAPGDDGVFDQNPFPAAKELVQRFLQRRPGPKREQRFIADLPDAEARYLDAALARWAGRKASDGRRTKGAARPLRVLVAGGIHEHHHNLLCFYSYLEVLEGRGQATFRVALDGNVTPSDLENIDVVILSRARSQNVAAILELCRLRAIPTIYMIDDNWLTAGRDWPGAYGDLFRPGSPDFDSFIFAIRNSDWVLTYNANLEHDLKAYAKRVVTLPNSVDLANFESFPRRQSDRFVIGYSGSPRYTSGAFEALAEVSAAHPDVDVLLFGDILSDQLKLFDEDRVIRSPFVPYSRYAEEIRKIGVDVLVAPLDDSRTSRSKCPNKYLEITAAGAVGAYSAIEPYTWYIRPGENGVLIENESAEAWARGLEAVLNKPTLQKMHAAAREDVALRYDVPVVASQFANLLEAVVAERRSK
jgi:glycosyltransferase involved in cell wall biosynthesis